MKFCLSLMRSALTGAVLSFGLVAGAANAAGLALNIADTGFDPIPAGGTIEYTIRIDNSGNARTDEDEIEFTIPEHATYSGTTGALTSCTPAAPIEGPVKITCDVPSMAPRERLESIVEVIPTQEGVITLEALITGQNVSNTEDTTINKGGDLELGFVAPDSIQGGEILEFTARVTNHGPNDNAGGEFSMMLPSALLSDEIEMPSGCDIAGNQVTCELDGTIPVDGVKELVFRSQVLTDDESTITVSGSISKAEPDDPNGSNNASDFDITVEPGTDVTLRKDRSPSGLLHVGKDVTFTLTPDFTGTTPLEASIIDDLPSNYELISVDAGSGWNCPTTNPVECTYSADSPDAAEFREPITITARAIEETSESGRITNTAEINSPDDVRPDNNTASDGGADIVEPATDLVAHKTGPARGLVTVDNEYDWKIWASNTGIAGNIGFAGKLILTEIVPEGLTVTGISTPSGWVCEDFTAPVDGPAEIICSTENYTEENPLEVGAKAPELTITALVTEEGDITNRARVSDENPNYPDADLSNNETSSGVTSGDGDMVGIADLSLEKTVTSTGPYQSGEQVAFEIKVINSGPDVAENVVLTDRLDDLYFADDFTTGVTLDNVPAGMSCTVTRGGGFYSDLSCDIAELPVCGEDGDDCPVLSFTAMAGGNAGTKQNSAEVYSTTTPDPDSDNNTGSATYEVEARTDLTVEKKASHPAGGEILAGHDLIYTLSAIVPENGLSAAEGVTVTDTLPAGLRIVDVNPSAGSCGVVSGIVGGLTTDGSTVSCDLGRVGNGNQQTVTIYVVPSTGLVGSTITNNVEVSTSTVEIEDDNNTDDISHEIIAPRIDLITNKTDSEDPIVVDGTTVYTVTVRNNGPSEAFDLEITDILPQDGLSFQDVTSKTSGLSCDPNGISVGQIGGELICSIGNLPVGATAEFDVEMKAEKRGRWTNRAEARSDEYDNETQTSNNDVDESTTVYELVDLEVIKEASPENVDLNGPFDWIITVRNLSDPGGLAENVELTDTLPENMEITGPVTSTAGNCDGLGRDLICILDDMERGDEITITVPTKVTAISSSPETLTNLAKVTTDSFEDDESNNTTSGDVEVRASTVSGTIWRDFNEDDVRDTEDREVSGVTVELTGTDKWGNDVSLSTTTDGYGRYGFDLLPPGDYRVSYTNPDETLYETGSAIPGSIGGGSAEGGTVIANIAATTDDPSVDNDFTLIPQARLALSKQLSSVALRNDDGSYDLSYSFYIHNESQEPVRNFILTDELLNTNAEFGTYINDAVPDHGEFTVSSITGATAGSASSNRIVLTSTDPLAAGQTHQIDLVLRVNPELPRKSESLTFTNNAEISGIGDWSTQTPEDRSNDGKNPQHGVESDTKDTVNFTPAIMLTKEAVLDSVGSVPAPGDKVRYSFTIENTGRTPLVDVELDDPLLDIVWDEQTPIPLLDPGDSDSTSYQAHYILTQEDIENGGVENTATVTGRWADDTVPNPTVSDQDSAEIIALAEPGLEVVKARVSDTIKDPTEIGDTIRYEFTVTNTGNIDLRNLELTDMLSGIVPDPATSFSIGTLAKSGDAGDSITFHADYTVTQGDIDAGEVVNSASVSGEYGRDNTPIEEGSNEVRTPLHQQPDMQVSKVLDGAEPDEPRAGDTVIWLITIENTGNTSLDIGTITEPLADTTTSAPVPAVLLPGETATATATHTLSQAEINAGEVINQVTVDGNVPGSNTPFDPTPSGNDPDNPNKDKTVTPLPAKPSIALLKELVTDVSGPLMPGDEIEFAFTIRNTGNVTLDNLVLTDEIPDVSLDTTILAGVSLAPDAEIMFSGTYELTVKDIEAGGLENTATVTGDDPHGTKVDDDSGTGFDNDDPTPVQLARDPQIVLIKTIKSAPTAPVEAGDVVEYAFEIRNTGNVELRDISLTDLVGGVTLSGSRSAPLPVDEVDTDSFTGEYVLTQADLDAGFFANSARADGTGTGPDGSDKTVSDISGTDVDNDTETVLDIDPAPALTITKDADDAAVQDPTEPGDEITYSFTVTNTGNVTLTDVTVTDPLLGGSFTGNVIASLEPGANAVLTATYAVTGDDIEAGLVENQADVTGDYFDRGSGGSKTTDPTPSNDVEVPLNQAAAIDLVKTITSSPGAVAQAGDIVTYGFTVTNIGNVELTDVTVDELLTGATVSGGPITLAVGEADSSSFTASYTLTQDDLERGHVDNQAEASGTGGGSTVTDRSGNSTGTDEETRLDIPQKPGITLIKTGNISGFADPDMPKAGDEIRYSFIIENTGNVILHDVTLTDPGVDFDALPAAFDLEPGEVRELLDVGGHVLSQAEVDAGEYENTAEATGEWGDDGNGGRNSIGDDHTVVTELTPEPGIDLVKVIDTDTSELSSPPEAGDVLHYAFTVTNTGNLTLTDIEIVDPLPDLELTGSLAMLEPGSSDSTSFSARYELTQADIERGEVVNQAVATGIWGEDPDGSRRTVEDDSGTSTGNDDPTVQPLDREIALAIEKEADDSALSDPAIPGEEITYSFTVTNTGNVTLTDVTVTDPLLGGSFSGNVIASLKPGEEQVLSAAYPITLGDIEAGLVKNQASVTGIFTDPETGDQSEPEVDSNEVEVPLAQRTAIVVVKTAASAVSDPAVPGEEITYSFTVTNIGNVTLKDVVLEDPLAGLSTGVFNFGDMAPGAEETRQATYNITQADIDAGEVVNQAVATGTFDDTPVSDLSGPDPESDEETRVPVPQAPGLALVKRADASAVTDPAIIGQEITYSFTVTNTGNVTLRDVEISDPLEGLTPGDFTIGEMAPGEAVTAGPAIYAITQADINASKVENRALAGGEYGPPDDPDEIETPSTNDEDVDGPTITPISGVPAIALVKALAPGIDAEALTLGDEIRWVFSVHNTGNVPLEGVTIAEEMIDANVSGEPISLEPGDVNDTNFTAHYRITQADLDAGLIENSARVTGVFDDGSGSPQEVEDISGTSVDDDDPIVTELGQRPAIDLVKIADVSRLGSPPQPGDEIHYSFTITNIGEITLSDVTIDDPMPDLELAGAPIPSLAPGAVNDSAYSAIYRLTQSDIDSGRALENQAEVTGSYTPPSGGPDKVTDLSGTETGTDTPTIVEIDREPGLEFEKTADDSEITVPAKPGQEIHYSFTITNTGNVTLSDVTVIDPLPGLVLAGSPVASLAPGESSDAITGTYPLTEQDIIATERENTARAEGIWEPDGGTPETVPSNESSAIVELGYPEIDFDITIGELRDLNGDGRMGPGDEVVFHFEVHNTGTVPLHHVNVDGDTLSVPLPGLICTPISLDVGESEFLTCTGAGHIITGDDANRGEIAQLGDATGTSDVGVVVRASSAAATLTNIAAGGLTLEKLAGVETAMIGDLVPYTIRISNAPEGVPVTARVIDTLPAGFTYRSESARLDGDKVELAENGRKLTLDPVKVDPGQTRVLTLQARVGGSVRPGAHDNRVRLISPLTGRDIAPEAKATVRVLADAVLQCATVIGRVFDDVDQNGHMSKSAEERGLPNIRLIAPNGLAILTDAHGRYNVPCAALPRAIGSNFMLKLDERSLPSGYRLTTENPRVVRLTPGMITRLDFGATLARLVRVDLAANSFNGAAMGEGLEAGLSQLVAEISGQVAMLRITYLQAPSESEADARQRMRMVERHLRDLWSREGKYKLNIETLIQRGGDAK